MKRFGVSALLWIYAGWYAGSLLAETMGASILIGLVPGILAAGLLLGLMRRLPPLTVQLPSTED